MQIQKQLLPTKSMSDLVIYYYNVWKTRGTPRARAWWHAVEEVWRRLSLVSKANEGMVHPASDMFASLEKTAAVLTYYASATVLYSTIDTESCGC